MINEYNFNEDQKPVVNEHRKIISKEAWDVGRPQGDATELQEFIDSLKERFKDVISWSLDVHWDSYDCDFYVTYKAWETDEEMQKRIKIERQDLKSWETIYNKRNAEKNAKAKQEKEERRKQFEALKKEFG